MSMKVIQAFSLTFKYLIEEIKKIILKYIFQIIDSFFFFNMSHNTVVVPDDIR